MKNKPRSMVDGKQERLILVLFESLAEVESSLPEMLQCHTCGSERLGGSWLSHSTNSIESSNTSPPK